MATINVTGIGAPFDFGVGATVNVEALPNTGATYAWTFLDRPEGSSATFAVPAAQATSFTADKEGTYLVQCVIDSIDVGRAVAVVPYNLVVSPVSKLISPAAGETFEKDATTGWARAIQDHAKVIAWLVNSGITGNLNYKGLWNALTNTPTLGDSGVGGVKGDYYVIGTAGTTSVDGNADWQIGDWIVHNGTTWDKIDNSDIHDALTAADKDLAVAAAKTIDDSDTLLTISLTPRGWVGVLVNGLLYRLGQSGDFATMDFYFRASGGGAVRDVGNIIATDELYVNPVQLGFALLPSMQIDMIYEVAQ